MVTQSTPDVEKVLLMCKKDLIGFYEGAGFKMARLPGCLLIEYRCTPNLNLNPKAQTLYLVSAWHGLTRRPPDCLLIDYQCTGLARRPPDCLLVHPYTLATSSSLA
jgi:hypothetical protein